MNSAFHFLAVCALVAVCVMGCGKTECVHGRLSHDWGKWRPDGRVNLKGQAWLVRECPECGMQQGTPAETL